MLARCFGSAPRSGISADLVLSASMGYAGKSEPQTHQQHADALKKLNIYSDERIHTILSTLDKADFCQKKSVESMKDKIPDFNPYSLDPQDIGHNQVLTSTVMHAVSLQHLIKPLETFSQDRPIKLLDVGCGKGYSTLAYAMLANTIRSKQPNSFQMTGVDYHSHFMERASLNLEKYANHLTKGSVKFRRHDFLKEKFEQKFDLLTFGFEVSKDVLIQN